MALFNSLKGAIGNAVGNAVGDGIGKGIQNAVGKAVESAVRPAADKLAGQAADHLNQTAQELADANAAMRAAAGEAAEGAQELNRTAANSTSAFAAGATGASASSGSGMADLGASLSGWASAMQGLAGGMAMNMKECPKCGEVVTADHKFCPKCGAPLPERTVGQGYVCPKCGKQNVPGTTYCAECGTMLPAAEEANAAQMAKWDVLLPQYPKWAMGGTIELEDGGSVNGERAVSVRVGGVGASELRRYVELLKVNGFIPVYSGDSDFFYKMVDGVCRAFDKTDANQGDFLAMTFYVGDFDKKAAAKEKADAALDTAKDTAKAAADAAKGLFKKFF